MRFSTLLLVVCVACAIQQCCAGRTWLRGRLLDPHPDPGKEPGAPKVSKSNEGRVSVPDLPTKQENTDDHSSLPEKGGRRTLHENAFGRTLRRNDALHTSSLGREVHQVSTFGARAAKKTTAFEQPDEKQMNKDWAPESQAAYHSQNAAYHGLKPTEKQKVYRYSAEHENSWSDWVSGKTRAPSGPFPYGYIGDAMGNPTANAIPLGLVNPPEHEFHSVRIPVAHVEVSPVKSVKARAPKITYDTVDVPVQEFQV